MGLLSVVIPAYNEEAMVPIAARRIRDILRAEDIEAELIFVDDGSSDGTWAAIAAAAKEDSALRGLRFSRNFGKEAALLAGLAHARGDCCATIDCDLQHPPEKLVEMYRLWQEGYQGIEGVKESRGEESALHGFCARAFYKIMTRATGIDMSRSSDFKLLDRRAVDAILSLPERDTFYRALSGWVGFRSASVCFEVAPREQGQSKWSGWKLTKYALRQITSFTSSPMQIVTALGALMLALAAVMGVQTLYNKFMGRAAEGFTTVIIVTLLVGSIIMMSLGIMGCYLAKMFHEVKGRPRYIVADELGGGA